MIQKALGFREVSVFLTFTPSREDDPNPEIFVLVESINLTVTVDSTSWIDYQGLSGRNKSVRQHDQKNWSLRSSPFKRSKSNTPGRWLVKFWLNLLVWLVWLVWW